MESLNQQTEKYLADGFKSSYFYKIYVQTNFNWPGSIHDRFCVFGETVMMTSASVFWARGFNNSFLHYYLSGKPDCKETSCSLNSKLDRKGIPQDGSGSMWTWQGRGAYVFRTVPHHRRRSVCKCVEPECYWKKSAAKQPLSSRATSKCPISPHNGFLPGPARAAGLCRWNTTWVTHPAEDLLILWLLSQAPEGPLCIFQVWTISVPTCCIKALLRHTVRCV